MFKSQQCYDQHKEPRGEARSVCQSWIKCTQCKKAVRRCCVAPEKHDCRKKKCGICGKFVKLERHYCFIQPETKKRKRKRSVEEGESGGFFDTECREEEDDDDEPVEETLTDLGTHEPNLCIVQNEAGEEWIFQGNTTQKDFCKWLFTDDHIGCTVMAHNFQGYDSYFVPQCLHEQGVKYDVIMRGGKTRRFPC